MIEGLHCSFLYGLHGGGRVGLAEQQVARLTDYSRPCMVSYVASSICYEVVPAHTHVDSSWVVQHV